MEESAVFAKVVSLVTPFCKNAEVLNNINEKTRFFEDLNVNSSRMVDIVLAVEDEFGIEVDDESLNRIRCVGDTVKLIMEKI